MINRIILNEVSHFGRNSRSVLPGEIRARNLKKALVVTDNVLLKAGVCDKVTSILKSNGLEFIVFSDVEQNPTVENVLNGLEVAKKFAADYIIAVGGGSAIDTAKCIGIIMTNPEHSDVVSLEGVVETKKKSLPLIAMPTTAGTAAEVTINYVITDKKNVKKMVCVDPNDIPIMAIIDPELMDSMPSSIKAATGMDALTHAMEGYITKGAWSMTDMFHLEAMKIIYNNLDDAVNKSSKDALDKIANAQYIAGMGFSNVGLGIVHSMAHALGANYGTPHGVANALLLPYVLKFNGIANVAKYKVMAEIFGCDTDGLSDEKIINLVVNSVRKLSKKVNIPQTLDELNVDFDDLEKMSVDAFNDVCTGGNPRDVTVSDILKIFKEAYSNKKGEIKMKTKVGYSINADSFQSGIETAKKACEGAKPKVGMLFTSVVNNQKDIVSGVRSVNPDMPIVGCTSSGAIIVPDGVVEAGNHGFSGMMTMDDENLVVGVAASESGSDARAIGRKVAKAAVKNSGVMRVPNYFYMVASPKEEEDYLKGIQDVIGRVPFFGGSAADDTLEGKWSIICNDQIINDGVAVAFFYTDKKMVTEYTGDYRETDKVGIITKVNANRELVEIDGVDALDKYMEWTGKSEEEVEGANLLSATILNPLGVKSRTGSLTSVCHPMSGDVKDTIHLGNKVSEKTAIILLEATVDELVKSTGKTLKTVNSNMKKKAAGYFLVHCGGRKMGIGTRLNEVHKELVEASNGAPFITIFTFGEYGYHNHSANTCGGLMLSFTGIEGE